MLQSLLSLVANANAKYVRVVAQICRKKLEQEKSRLTASRQKKTSGEVSTGNKSAGLKTVSVEICILAGGLSSRMGRDKSKLRLAGKTLLTRIRKTAETIHVSVRIIRRDLVPGCGPLGGIFTALKTTSAEAVLFLACDMPNISPALLEKVLQRSGKTRDSLFTWNDDTAGFPFVLNRRELPVVEKVLAEKRFSLQNLASKVRAITFRPGRLFQTDLLNINTPEDWARLKQLFIKSSPRE